MICSEEEAKKKWCPFTRIAVVCGNAGAAVNRYPLASTIEPECFCIASDCMAWNRIYSGNVDNPTKEPNKGFAKRLISGYCGLTHRED